MLRLSQIMSKSGRSRSSIFKDVRDGFMTPPVAIGLRAIAWPSHEVETIMAARVQARSNVQIKELVASLIAARTA
jgi:prophage regulatory protein